MDHMSITTSLSLSWMSPRFCKCLSRGGVRYLTMSCYSFNVRRCFLHAEETCVNTAWLGLLCTDDDKINNPFLFFVLESPNFPPSREIVPALNRQLSYSRDPNYVLQCGPYRGMLTLNIYVLCQFSHFQHL